MKFLCLIILTLSSLSHAGVTYKWSVNDSIKNPESVYYDSSIDKIFVSNIDGGGTTKDGKGHISLLANSGKMLKANWLKGLNAPKGMRSLNGKLWVSDIDELVEIDIKKEKIIKKYPIKGAKFLNDIAVSKNGEVYVSDTITSKIHILKNGKISTFVEGDKYESPNGLLLIKDDLYVAAWGLTTDWSTKVLGRLYKINLKNKKITYISKAPLGHLDGLEVDNDGNFLVSDWSKGLIYKVTTKGSTKIIHKGKKGLADIGYILKSKTILIPYMNDNEVQGI